ncbi:hypothetical protein EG346_15810 [Chryseobacterium carnipullorum]|uniref:Uncharacterized protein n=1 Tax=Chryseobacterium carnipullorum TaxID=1124835 RepID=A0A376DSK5_CHRCU|nr:hypothetical protein [Chryseobacterium carnipullorum]AZA49552.1 hypothetical protein EG346_15810 [Chryseobacterium carnipullorum]AZA64449.1 hypothetical protein EG345_06825 [Chryseobacterium carnipullorum]STC94794.1 Uncharacterised protein [Chryseobacterium carnipullorum]
METKFAQWPPFRSDLRKQFGYLSFNCTLINLDIIGIKLLKSGEVVAITYRGARKTGFIYEGGKLTDQQVFRAFTDVPLDYNELEKYEKEYLGRIEILAPPKDNYVFVNEQEIMKK